MKTKKTLAKRIKITKTGKIMHKHTSMGHLKRKLTANRKTRKEGYVKQEANAQVKRIKKLLGKAGKGVN